MDNLNNEINDIINQLEENSNKKENIDDYKEVKEIIDNNQTEEDDILDLLEETDTDDLGFTEDDDGILNQEFPQPNLENLEDFDIDKYLSENYSFKEIDNMSLDEYKDKELQKKEIQNISKLYEKGYQLKDLPTFDDFIKFKKDHVNIYTIRFGLPFEYELFGMEPKLFICKVFSSEDYSDMLNNNPNAENDINYFNDFIISRCILFPEIRIEDVKKLEYGIADILLQAILKHSRFNPNYKIERL